MRIPRRVVKKKYNTGDEEGGYLGGSGDSNDNVGLKVSANDFSHETSSAYIEPEPPKIREMIATRRSPSAVKAVHRKGPKLIPNRRRPCQFCNCTANACSALVLIRRGGEAQQGCTGVGGFAEDEGVDVAMCECERSPHWRFHGRRERRENDQMHK